jgi:bacterioferritin (cytochrome b1)
MKRLLSIGNMDTSKYISRIASRVASVTDQEGQFAVPNAEVIAHLQNYINAKYAIYLAYRTFAGRVKGPWRDSLVDHWHEHANEEISASYDLTMKVVGLGADPVQTAVQIPLCVSNLSSFCSTLMSMELKAIENGRKLIEMAGDNTAMKVLAENLVMVDTKHLDDLKRMMPKVEEG